MSILRSHAIPASLARALGSLGCAVAMLAAAAGPASADDNWPSKPSTIIHGMSTGGSVDTAARLIADSLSHAFGQQFVVEMKPGAGGTLAALEVSRRGGDGYTFALFASNHAIAPAMLGAQEYDPVSAFRWISLIATSPTVIYIREDHPARNIEGLVELARAEPGAVTYGAGGIGTTIHLGSLLLQKELGIEMTHVPYRGGTETGMAVASGEIDAQFGTVASSVVGTIPVAVTSLERLDAFPDTPTISETVLPGFETGTWYGIAAPAGTPDDIVEKIKDAIHTALNSEGLRERMIGLGLMPVMNSPEEFTGLVAEEVERWRVIVEENNLAGGG